MEMQNTIKSEAAISGIALHTGVRIHLRMKPAPENTGIVFRRTDMPGAPEVRAYAPNVIDVRRATTIAAPSKAYVVTVEHIMAAFHAAGVDNAYVEMDNAEPPVADGSAGPYFKMIKEAGIQEQNAPAQFWTTDVPLYVENGATSMVVLPSDTFKISCTVAFGETALDTQFYSLEVTPENFEKELGPCRTFVAYRDLAQLIAAGLAKGGSLDNAVILHDGAIISNNGLRFPNELVRHKIMDMVGDLYLTGKRVRAHVIAIKPGHSTNVQLAKLMLARETAQK